LKKKIIAVLIGIVCMVTTAVAAEREAPATPVPPAAEIIAAPVAAAETPVIEETLTPGETEEEVEAAEPAAAQKPPEGKAAASRSQPSAPEAAAAQGAVDGKPAPAGASTTSSMPVTGTYIIGPGDMIEASVWKDEALRGQFIVLPDGTISFPLIGELQAAGRTLSDLKKEMVEKISVYAPDPTFSIEVKQVNSMLIYVIGRVNQSSRFSLNANVTVLQALAMAGGLNPFAKRDKIKVFRQEGDKTKILRFHYDDVVEGKRLEENITLKRGDVIVVP
jgi:polysaccharide export outer membrane protein